MVGTKIILLVEDEDSIRESLREFLESEGYKVTTAWNGKEALEFLKKNHKPALVLLDMMMPIMGGREFLDLIREDTELAPIPVVVVSATAHPSEAKRAHGFLRKPIDLEALLKLVKQHC